MSKEEELKRLVLAIKRQAQAGEKPSSILRSIKSSLSTEDFSTVIVSWCLTQAFDLQFSDVAFIGAWHEFGRDTCSDQEIDVRLSPIINSYKGSEGPANWRQPVE